MPKEVAETVKDRLNHKIIGPFLLTWILCNWKVPTLLLTGTTRASERIADVSIYFSNTSNLSVWIIPIGIWLFYLAGLPPITEWYEQWPRKYRLRKEKKDKRAQYISDQMDEIQISFEQLTRHCINSFKNIQTQLGHLHTNMTKGNRADCLHDIEAIKSLLHPIIQHFGSRFEGLNSKMPDVSRNLERQLTLLDEEQTSVNHLET